MGEDTKTLLKCDLVIPFGVGCQPAYYTQKFGMRICAFPLDWMMLYRLDKVAHLFETNFNDFFLNVKEIESDTKHRKIEDTLNLITSVHHFSREVDIETGKVLFRNVMLNRYNKLNAYLKILKNICILTNVEAKIEELKEFLIRFSNVYPHINIICINIMDSDNKYFEEYTINDKSRLIMHYFKNQCIPGGEVWKGNEQEWELVMSNIRLSNKLNLFRENPKPFD